MILAFVNKSTLVSDDQAALIAKACVYQINFHASPLFRQWGCVGGLYADGHQPAGADVLYFFDDADQAGALGYHTEDPSGSVYGRIFARDTLSQGAQVLTGPGSVCTVASHEALELWQDRNVDKWAMAPDGNLYAWEVGDPVEADHYDVHVKDAHGQLATVSVSNFVLPEWFDDSPGPGARFDYMGRLSAPFTLSPGGYVVYATLQANAIQQKFGDGSNAAVQQAGAMSVVAHFGPQYPEWKKQMKSAGAARTARRFAGSSRMCSAGGAAS